MVKKNGMEVEDKLVMVEKFLRDLREICRLRKRL